MLFNVVFGGFAMSRFLRELQSKKRANANHLVRLKTMIYRYDKNIICSWNQVGKIDFIVCLVLYNFDYVAK